MRAKNIWVVGGDRRQRALASLLRENGQEVHTVALGETGDGESWLGMERAECVILPLPAAGGEGTLNAPFSGETHRIPDILDGMKAGQLLCAGMADEALRTAAAERGILLRDYFAREELAVLNAVPTAEGAIQIAMEKLPVTIHGAEVLVIGFGRIGQALSLRLRGLEADVTVCARRAESRALAAGMGLRPADMAGMGERLGRCALVVNTVPAPVLGEREVRRMGAETVVIDLASPPGGVVREAAAALGPRYIWARGLPGKVAPVTAGRYILDTVYHIMEELGV